VKLVSVAQKLITIDLLKVRNCFGEEIAGAKVTNPKIALNSSDEFSGDTVSRET
jgi:hypothetical protein